MVRITNGIDIFEVTSGAYENNFKKLGFTIMGEEKKEVPVEENVEQKKEEDKEKQLIEKPLSKWTKAEVKGFAEENGIDLTGTKNVDEAKKRISAFLEQ